MQDSVNEKCKEQISVIERYKRGDKSVEWRLFELFESLIEKIARNNRSALIDENELIQAGRIGLWKGANSFDATVCDNPEVYMKTYIDGSMKDEIRKSVTSNIHIPRNVYYKVKDMQRERSQFEKENGRMPNNVELADRLGVTQHKIEEWNQAERFISIDSLDIEVEGDFSIIETLTDGQSAEDNYIRYNDTCNLILDSVDINIQEAPSEIVANIIENAESFATQFGLSEDEFLNIFTKHLNNNQKCVECAESEKEKILSNIISGTNFYWPFSYRLIAYILKMRPELANSDSIIDFLVCQMSEKSIPYLKESISNWFNGTDIQKSGEAGFRESMYKICFALELDISETQEFFKQVVLDKAFYIRDIKEFVYYYCIKNHLSYQMASELISQAISVDSEERESHTLHETKAILESLVISRSSEKLLGYIRRNPQDFDVRNLTAKKQIDDLIADICIRDEEKNIIKKWQEIEKHIERVRTSLKNDDATSIDAINKRAKVANLEKEQTELLKTCDTNSSVLFWEFVENPSIVPKGVQMTTEPSMLTMIYGFNIDERKNAKKNVSLGQQVIQRNLPNRQMRRMFMDEKDTYEYIRKALIVIASYQFWRMQAAGQVADDYEEWMNRLLCLSNLEVLYESNPFDWLMMRCACGDNPVMLFREITEELV